MAKGFAYQWNPTKLNTQSAAFQRAIVENFRQIEIFLNSYAVRTEADGVTTPLADLTVSGITTLATAPIVGSGGPEHAMVYRDTSAFTTAAAAWDKLEFNATLGTSGTLMTEDTSTAFSVSVSQPGIYLVRAQAIWAAAENGSIRILEDGTERLRSSADNKTVLDVCGVVWVTSLTGSEFTAEVFMDTAADAQVGSNNTFMSVTRLQSLA